MTSGLRRTGIDAVGNAPWQTHFCMFYRTREELLSIVVPYLKAGLEEEEACVWVLSGIISPEEAHDALAAHFEDLPERIEKGQIEILRADEWYTPNGRFDPKEVLLGWRQKVFQARARGFEGLRATGDTSWLSKEDWDTFMQYESEIGTAVRGQSILVLCTYSFDLWEAFQVVDVVSTHEFSLMKVGDVWKQIENSERRKAIQEKLAVEEKYRRTIENIRVAVYSALPDDLSTTVFVTDKIKDITGYDASELLSNAELYGRMVHPDDRAEVWAAIKSQRKNKSVLSAEYRIVTKSGDIKWVKDEATPVLDEAGNLLRIDGYIEDVTERRNLVDALQRSEERFKLAQKAANIGSWDWNIATGELVWSEEIEPMFGYDEGKFEKTYSAFLKSVHPDDRKFVENSVNDCIEKAKTYDIEHRIVWPGGSVHWMAEKGDVIRDGNRKAVRMLGVVRDTTTQKIAEHDIINLNRDLERKSAELAAANKELEAFAYSASHDLRAPLRRIDGFSEILLRTCRDNLDRKTLDHLQRIRSNVKDMDALIEGMLKLSKLSTAGLSQERVDLSSLAGDVVRRLKASDPDRKVQADIQDGLTVVGDHQLLNIALENLIGNSWKFTCKRPDARIEFGAEIRNGHKTFFVKDNGVGFDKAHADKLFSPFQRLHNGSEYQGYGIGLALVSRVIGRHKGRVWAEAEQGKGATFYFTLEDDGQKTRTDLLSVQGATSESTISDCVVK